MPPAPQEPQGAFLTPCEVRGEPCPVCTGTTIVCVLLHTSDPEVVKQAMKMMQNPMVMQQMRVMMQDPAVKAAPKGQGVLIQHVGARTRGYHRSRTNVGPSHVQARMQRMLERLGSDSSLPGFAVVAGRQNLRYCTEGSEALLAAHGVVFTLRSFRQARSS